MRPQHANARAAENKMSSALESSSIEGEDGVGEDRIGETVELASPSSSSGAREKSNASEEKNRVLLDAISDETSSTIHVPCHTYIFYAYDKIVSFAARVVSTWEPDSRLIGENTEVPTERARKRGATCLAAALISMIACGLMFYRVSLNGGRLMEGGMYGYESEPSSSDGGRVGFYLQMANEPKATLELIRSVRVHFPDAPLSVTSDAGSYDCSAACETYGCVFTREDTTAGMHGGGGVMEYVRRLKRAAESAETEWIVLLEDDVRVERGVTRWPKEGIDGGGVQDWRWTAPLSKELLAEIARRNGGRAPSYKNYGLCGGAIVRASALASLPDDLPEEEMHSLQKMDDRFGMWNDVTLSALLMLGGHALEPWDDVKQGNHPAHATAFVHNDKRWYGVRMDAEDKKLCKPQDKV